MLIELHVKNIALIEEVKLKLHDNLNIFSGETGAGKSMLIDSIQFAIGNRTSKQIVRKGQQCAYVLLEFQDTKNVVIPILEENGIPYEGRKIILERTLYTSGRTVYKINGVTSTRGIVRDIATLLIDVHGQHEPQSLLETAKHINLLDGFGDEQFIAIKHSYDNDFTKWQAISQKLSDIDIDDRKKLQLKDMLTFQIEEIEMANLKVGEEDELKAQYQVLANAEKILIGCQKAYACLESEDGGALSLTGLASRNIQDIANISVEISNFYDTLEGVQSQLQDVMFDLRRYTEQIEYSPEVLVDIQNRLDTIYKLRKKYGDNIEEILEYKDKCQTELDEMLSAENDTQHLQNELLKLENILKEKAEQLTKMRICMASSLEGQIETHLRDLQMPHAQFKINVTLTDIFTKNGQNNVEFLIKTNLGDDLHPLSKIASGGEISRVMLALKTVLLMGDTIETVIFDEIDSGISGIAAQKVAEKLAIISSDRQVICITHLPQIAAMANNHYLIEKNVVNDFTQTSLQLLTDTQIYQELSRLMGGIQTAITLQSARELKELANKYKETRV
ncbi:MAG: DNA repair protein RecN [Epulopiscium sp. Nele67-Bin004]|nr:MAG: DNA repair protein RecN [Epulopiscium sp. Nele67-Bin004]